MKTTLLLPLTIIVLSFAVACQALMAEESKADANKGYVELEQKNDIRCAAFSPDGKLVVTSGKGWGEEAVAVIWERSTGMKLRTLQHHDKVSDSNGIKNLVAFSPDGKKIATTGYNGDDEERYSLVIWDVATGNKEHIIKEKSESFGNCVLFSPNGKLLLTDIDRNECRWAIWSVEKGIMLKKLDNAQRYPQQGSVTFSSDNTKLFDKSELQVIDIATGNVLVKKYVKDDDRRNGHREAQLITISQDGTKVYQKGESYETPLFDALTGRLVAFGKDAVQKIAKTGVKAEDATFFGQNYEIFLPYRSAVTIGCYDRKTGDTVYALHYAALTERTWKYRTQWDFRKFAKRALNRDIPEPEEMDWEHFYYTETTSGELLVLTWFRHQGIYTGGATFIKDGKIPAKTIPINTNTLNEKNICCVSPQGNYLGIRVGNDCEFWNLRTGERIGTVLDTGRVEECIFSPDGESFMVRINNGRKEVLQIWDMKSFAAMNKKQAEQQEDADKILREALQ